MKNKFVATPKGANGGFIVERFNEAKGVYELFCPQGNDELPENYAKSLASFMNYLSEV